MGVTATGHLLLRASAGTGKTFALSSRYLALLLAGVDADRILATTFTRKAAREILDRVLERLAEAARGGSALEALSSSVGRTLTAQDCLAALERLLRSIDRVRIGTIDSWFAQLARLAALDLGLPYGWRFADESESQRLRSEAVAEAVASAVPLELLELLRNFQRQSTGSGAHELLLDFSRKGREILLESAPDAWSAIRPLDDADPARLEEAVRELPRMPIPRTKAGKEHSGWARARERLARLLEVGDWSGVLDSGLVARVVLGGAYYGSALDPAQLAILEPIVARALHRETEAIVLQNAASLDLLRRYEEAYRGRSRGLGRVGFEDLPNALAPVAGDDPLGGRGVDLVHRLGARIDHLLLDEFQDTAPAQWRVLRPLADGILDEAGSDRSFFCVGDEKQSIYGWRSAEPRLLRSLDANRPALRREDLDRSYRSGRPVLAAVNRVFGTLEENPAFEGAAPEVREAAEEFEAAFPVHEPSEERPGGVFLVRARPAETGAPRHAPVLRAAVERVRAILDEAPAATVGVLVRERKWIGDLVRRLREAGLAASDEGGNPLTDSVAVLHVLSLLHLADHPGDTAAAFHVATSPLGRVVGLEPATFRERAGTVAREVRARLAEIGYGEYLASIRPTGEYASWDLGRFGQLVDLALAWEARAGSRPGSFVENVRTTQVEDPSTAQVRVMTVHSSKGLQFDAVVLPDLDRSLHGRSEPLLTRRPHPEGPIEVVTHPLRKGVAAAHPLLETVRKDVVRRRIVEELCVLYVAMTRAKYRVDLVVRGREEEGGGLTSAAILRGAFGMDASGPEGVAWTQEGSTVPWHPESLARPVPRGAGAAAEPRSPLRLAPSRRARVSAVRSPSRAADPGPVRARDLLAPRDAATARGKLVHRFFEEVEWVEAFDRSDEDLLAVGRRLEADHELVTSALAEFRRALEQPTIRRALSRPEGGATVWRERRFAVRLREADGREALWTGSFDRVVLLGGGGRTREAEILDFKTDRVDSGAIASRIELHRPQMLAYRRALSRITGLGEDAIRLRLVFLAVGRVEDVPG